MRPLPAITLLVLGLCTSAVVRAQVLGPSPGPFGENNQNNIGSSLWETSDTQILTPGNGRPPAWRSRYDPVYKRSYIAPAIAENHCKGKCSGMPGMTYPYEEYILDPTANSTALAEPVIRVWYPKGSWAPASPFPGGTLFFMYPYKSDPTKDLANPLSTVSAALEYEVYFPIDFDFNKGGKLPGMSGGLGNGRGCGGGADPSWCFSFRIMWRRNGWGEAYLYVPHYMQAPDFCTKWPPCTGNNQPCIVCDYEAGVSFARGSFVFQKGAWNKIYMNLTLNTPNVTNGIVEIRHNDQMALYYDKINWRQTAAAHIEGVEFATWFGGGDDTWAPPQDTYTMFRNFRVWRDDPPADITAQAVMESLPHGQVVVQEYMQPGV